MYKGQCSIIPFFVNIKSASKSYNIQRTLDTKVSISNTLLRSNEFNFLNPLRIKYISSSLQRYYGIQIWHEIKFFNI